MIKRVTVNRNVVASNKKHGTNKPVLSVQTSKGVTKCYDVLFKDAHLIQKAPHEKGLSCGATVWIQTTAPILVRTEPEDGEYYCID
jgi:hypothetical protein